MPFASASPVYAAAITITLIQPTERAELQKKIRFVILRPRLRLGSLKLFFGFTEPRFGR